MLLCCARGLNLRTQTWKNVLNLSAVYLVSRGVFLHLNNNLLLTLHVGSAAYPFPSRYLIAHDCPFSKVTFGFILVIRHFRNVLKYLCLH